MFTLLDPKPGQSYVSYGLRLGILSSLANATVTLTIGLISSFFSADSPAGPTFFSKAEAPTLFFVFGTFVLIALVVPIIETFIFFVPIYLIGLLPVRRSLKIIAPAVLFAALHSLEFWVWGIGVFALFVISTYGYWSLENQKLPHRLVFLALVHMVNNGIIGGLMVITRVIFG